MYGAAVGGYAAYLYPPVLAQIMAPLSLLPFPVFVWGWRLVQLACVRSVTGSWTWTGLALLVWPPLLAEIDACNVHLFIAAAVAMAIRSDGRAVVPVALTKFASLAAVPLAFVSDRRGLAVGTLLAVGIVAISFALSPSLWADYLQFLPTDLLDSTPRDTTSAATCHSCQGSLSQASWPSPRSVGVGLPRSPPRLPSQCFGSMACPCWWPRVPMQVPWCIRRTNQAFRIEWRCVSGF